jgi:hypothetical protein
MESSLLEAARAAKGFMPDDEGLALHDAALAAGTLGPLLEIGTYCGKSAIYLGAGRSRCGNGVVHGRPSPRVGREPGGLGAPRPEVVDPRTGRMDTLPFFRRTIEAAGLEDVVVAVIGHSRPVARRGGRRSAFLFIDGGHAEDVAMADYEAWSTHVVRTERWRSTTCSRIQRPAARRRSTSGSARAGMVSSR